MPFLLSCRAVQPALVPEDAAFPQLDFVCISHNHYDHLDTGGGLAHSSVSACNSMPSASTAPVDSCVTHTAPVSDTFLKGT